MGPFISISSRYQRQLTKFVKSHSWSSLSSWYFIPAQCANHANYVFHNDLGDHEDHADLIDYANHMDRSDCADFQACSGSSV